MFLNYLKINVSHNVSGQKTLKEKKKKKIIFCIFENECHTLGATG